MVNCATLLIISAHMEMGVKMLIHVCICICIHGCVCVKIPRTESAVSLRTLTFFASRKDRIFSKAVLTNT